MFVIHLSSITNISNIKCTKAPYPSRKEAHHHMRRIMQKGKQMRAYVCPDCYKYQLTSDVRGKWKEIKGI